MAQRSEATGEGTTDLACADDADLHICSLMNTANYSLGLRSPLGMGPSPGGPSTQYKMIKMADRFVWNFRKFRSIPKREQVAPTQSKCISGPELATVRFRRDMSKSRRQFSVSYTHL